MNENNTQSFETVDLLSPIELTPISGIEGIKTDLEPKQTQETPEKKEPEYFRDAFNSRDDGQRFDQYSEPAYSDPERFFREENLLRKKMQDEKRKKTAIMTTGLTIGILLGIVIFVLGKRFLSERSQIESISETVKNPGQEMVSTNDYAFQDDVYGTIPFNYGPSQALDYFELNPEIIEYTGPYERTLYFRVTPKENNVVLSLDVEMTDKYGNSFGTVKSFTKDLPAGEEGIVPISFGINEYSELNGANYKIKAEAYKMQDEVSCKKITSTEQNNGILYVTIEGDLSVTKDAYVVFYRNDKVCSVMRRTVKYGEDNKAVFYLGDVDYDSYEVYY